MINWFQKYEDFKRYSHAISGKVRYINTSPAFRNIEDRLTYRNIGLDWDTSTIRNVVQLHSTEGVISSFFTKLSMSRLSSFYQDHSFYTPFTNQAKDSSVSVKQTISPLQNMFIKYYYVFRNYMVDNNSDRSQFIDFIEGYIQSFPEEENLLKEIYEEVTGITYTNQLPPPLWILVEDQAHRLLTLDPYGGIEVPIYTFDLNAAEEQDLLSMNGLSVIDARTILEFRKNNGLFQSLDDVRSVPGLNDTKAELLLSNAFEISVFEETLSDFDAEISIGTLIVKPVIYILIRISAYFLLAYILLYFLIQRMHTKSILSRIYHILRYYVAWVFTSFLGLVLVVMMPNPLLTLILCGIVLQLTLILIYRKRKNSLIYTSSMFLIMLLPVISSMI
jgi:hypothetical protein